MPLARSPTGGARALLTQLKRLFQGGYGNRADPSRSKCVTAWVQVCHGLGVPGGKSVLGGNILALPGLRRLRAALMPSFQASPDFSVPVARMRGRDASRSDAPCNPVTIAKFN